MDEKIHNLYFVKIIIISCRLLERPSPLTLTLKIRMYHITSDEMVKFILDIFIDIASYRINGWGESSFGEFIVRDPARGKSRW